LLTKVRTLIHEEISLPTVLYFPFRARAPDFISGWLHDSSLIDRQQRRVASESTARRAGATNNQTAKQNANGVLAPAPLQAMRPTVSSEQSDLLKLVRPDNAASLILTAIKVLSEEAHTYTGEPWLMASVITTFSLSPASYPLSALTERRSAIGHRALVSDITRTVTKGGKMTTALARLVPQPRFTFCDLGSLASNIAPDFQGQ
jgi:hypothetical protein